MSQGIRIGARLLAGGIVAASLAAASAVTAQAATNYRTLAAITVRYNNTPVSASVSLADARRATFTETGSPAELFNRVTHGQRQFIGLRDRAGDVFGTWTLPMAAPTVEICNSFSARVSANAHLVALWLAALANGVDLSSYNNVVVFTPTLPGCGAGGFADFNGQAAFVAKESPVAAMAAVASHEVGHTFTLSHAGKLECKGPQFAPGSTCEIDPYGDDFDMMGSSRIVAGGADPLQAFSLARIQARPAGQIQTIAAGTGGTFRLTGIGQATGEGIKLLMIPRQRPAALLPVAQCVHALAGACASPFGYQNLTIEAHSQGVLFHLTAATTATNMTTLLRNDQGYKESYVGESLTDPATGVRITVTDRSNGGATVVLSKQSASALARATESSAAVQRAR